MSEGIAGKPALITGAARRLGAEIAERLHHAGMNVAIHYRGSGTEAEALRERLETDRPDSVSVHGCDLRDTAALPRLVHEVEQRHGDLHALVNNASSFYPTPVGEATESQWGDLIDTNVKAPFFLAQAAAAGLARNRGVIVNMADIYAERPLPGHALYNISKAGIMMLTQTLARELAPEVRVNAIAPGPILWPESPVAEDRSKVMATTPLARCGEPRDIADAVLFLIRDARYTTGALLPVDGGRRIAGY